MNKFFYTAALLLSMAFMQPAQAQIDPTAFVTVWTTTTGTIAFPGIGNSYNISWKTSDGRSGSLINLGHANTFAYISGLSTSAAVTDTVTATNGSNGTFYGFDYRSLYNKNGSIVNSGQTLQKVINWGSSIRFNFLDSAFYQCQNLTITATDIPNFVGYNLAYMFYGCSSLVTVPNMDKWNVSNVSNMELMFASATVFNQPLDGWNTGKVQSMQMMFAHAAAFNQPLNNWNTGSLVNMGQMFYGASSFNQPLGNWNLKSIAIVGGVQLSGSALDCINYSSTLVGWANNLGNTTPINRTLDADNLTYGVDAATQQARAALRAAGWYIQGDAQGTCTLPKQSQTITWNQTLAGTYGGSPITLTATASSGLPVTYTSSNTSVATVSGNTLTIVGGGSATITASQAGNDIYDSATRVTQNITIGKANQSITWNQTLSGTYGNPPITLTATASSGLPITYTSSNTSVATVSGNTLTIVGGGSATITASQAGNNNYAAANATQNITVTQPVTGISLNATATTLTVGSTGQLIATVAPTNATNKNATWSSSNTSVATVSSTGLVTAVAAGMVMITATTQDGNKTASCVVTVTVTSAPVVFSTFTLNDGDLVALYPTVELSYTWSGGAPAYYMASENANFSGAAWQAYNSSALTYTFVSDATGMKTVYTKLKNDAGETAVKTDSIYYKPYHPVSLSSFTPNNGVAVTATRTITLNHIVDSGTPTLYSISESQSDIGKTWLPYSPLPTYTLSAGNGEKELFFAVSDGTSVSNTMSAKVYQDGASARLYPNPVKNLLNIEMASNSPSPKIHVQVYSASGSTLLEKDFNANTFSLDLSHCAAGVLLVKLSDGVKTETYKIIKL